MLILLNLGGKMKKLLPCHSNFFRQTNLLNNTVNQFDELFFRSANETQTLKTSVKTMDLVPTTMRLTGTLISRNIS